MRIKLINSGDKYSHFCEHFILGTFKTILRVYTPHRANVIKARHKLFIESTVDKGNRYKARKAKEKPIFEKNYVIFRCKVCQFWLSTKIFQSLYVSKAFYFENFKVGFAYFQSRMHFYKNVVDSHPPESELQ